MAKEFFCVCAGLFLLAVSFVIGAASVRAQVSQIEAANMEFSGTNQFYTCVIGRTMYAGGGYPWDTRAMPSLVPGSEPIVATSGMFAGPSVMLGNGDVYVWSAGWNTTSGNWTLLGNILGSPVGATKSSWGSLKTGAR